MESVVGRIWVGAAGNWTLLYANSQFMVAIRKETPRPERLCFNRRHADRAGPVYNMDGLVFLIIIFFFFSSYLFIFLSCRPRLECMAWPQCGSAGYSIMIERLSADAVFD